MTTDLSERMQELAAAGHPRADELLRHAKDFDDATEEMTDESGRCNERTKRFLGVWANARRVYEECTGKKFVS